MTTNPSSDYQQTSSEKTPTLRASQKHLGYIEFADKEDDNGGLPPDNIKSLIPGQPIEGDKERCQRFPLWTPAAEENQSVRSLEQPISNDKETEGSSPCQRNRREVSSSPVSVNTGPCTGSESSCEIEPAETTSSAAETLCEAPRDSLELPEGDTSESERYKQVRSISSEGRAHNKDDASNFGESRLPPTPGGNGRQFTSATTYAQDVDIHPFCYGAWRASTDVPATASLEWESAARFTNEAISADSFSSVLHCPTLPASPRRNTDEASREAAEDVYLRAIERLSPSSSTCRGHAVDQHSPADQQARPLSLSAAENQDTTHIHAHGHFPCYSRIPQFAEGGASAPDNDSCSIIYQDGTGPYFCPVQQSSSAFSSRPPQTPLIPPLLHPLTSDPPLPFFLPPLSPSCAAGPDSLTSGRVSPTSPRILADSLVCTHLQGCAPAAARKEHTTCDAKSPSDLSLPGSPPDSPRYNETTWETSCSSAVLRESCLSEPRSSTTEFHQDGSESADVSKTETPRRQFDPPASSTPSLSPEGLSPTEVQHAAATRLHPSSAHRRQRIVPVEETGAFNAEQSTQGQPPETTISPALLELPSHNDHDSAVLLKTGILVHETATLSSPRDSRARKVEEPQTADVTCFATRPDSRGKADSLIKENGASGMTVKGNDQANDSSFFVKYASHLPASVKIPFIEENLDLPAQKSFPPEDAPAPLPTENESLPPLLLGRNSLPLPPSEKKPLPYGYGTSSESPQQKPEHQPDLCLPAPSTQELATPQTDTSGIVLDSKKPMQVEACSEPPQQPAPLTSPLSATDELHQAAGIFEVPFPFPFSHQMPQPFQYTCPGHLDTSVSFVNDSSSACANPLLQQASRPSVPQELRVGHAVDSNTLPVVGPPTLLGSFPFAFPNVFWGGNRHLAEPAADQMGQQVYGYPNVLPYPLLASQYPPNLPEPDAATLAAYNCGVPLPPPWFSESPSENVALRQLGGLPISADNLQSHMPHQGSLSPGRLSDAGSYVPRVVAIPPLFRDANTDLSLETHPRPAPGRNALGFLPSAAGPRATLQSFVVPGEVYRRAGTTTSRNNASESARCALRLAKSSRKRRLLPKCTPPEFATRDHKDYLLELLACNLEPVKGVHMDRLRKTWVASWLVGKRRVTRIFSFQKFGFFGAREQAIRQRREALLNPELESEEAQRVVAAAAGAAAAAASSTTHTACTGAADTGGEDESSLSPDRRLVQKIADSLPFVVGVTYHGESFSWIANHRKPMGKIVARRRFSIAEYGFLEARRRAAVMMFHWHKQGRVVEPEDYDQGAAAIFNAQQRPQVPDANNSEGFVYWYPACTANEPLYLLTAFDEETCDEAMVLLSSICGNPWKKVCKGQPQGGVDEVLPPGCETAATARFLSSFHSEGACTNWYLSNSQKREKNTNFWEAIKKGRFHLDAKESCSLSPRKKLKINTSAKKNPYARKYASSEAQEKAQSFRNLLVSPGSGAHEQLRRRQDQAPCKSKNALQRAGDEEKGDSGWEEKTASPCQVRACGTDSAAGSCTRKDDLFSRKTHVLLNTRTLDRRGEVKKEALVLRCNARSNAHSSATKGKPALASSTYWTRRKQAEQSGRGRDDSDNDARGYPADKVDALRSSKGASHTAQTLVQDTDAHEQPHSAQDVLRACFGSEPVSVVRSAGTSRDGEEPETLMCNPPSVEADETDTEAEEEEVEEADEGEEVEEEEDEEEVEEEEEPVSALPLNVDSRSFSVRSNRFELTDSKNRHVPSVELISSAPVLYHNRMRRRHVPGSFKESAACEDACADARPPVYIEHGPSFNSGASSFAQPAHRFEGPSWFPESFVENVALLRQGSHDTCNIYCAQQRGEQCGKFTGSIFLPQQPPGQFCRSRCSSFYPDVSQMEPLQSSILPATKSGGETHSPSVTQSSSAECWTAANQCRPDAYATIEEASEPHSIQSENYQDSSPPLLV